MSKISHVPSCECTDHAPLATRRLFLGMSAAASAGAILPGMMCRSVEAAPATTTAFVDVHHHFFPKPFINAAAQGSSREVAAFQKNWTPEKSLQTMDANGIRTAVLSLTFRDIWSGDVARGRQVARACNEAGAQILQDHANRFGLFACLPLPDIDGSLQEIAYALDTLKADGIEIFTSYDNKWPGDKEFAPIFAELNRRKASVFFHPLAPSCCGGLLPGVNDNFIEYTQDTGRAMLSLLFGGVFSRNRDINWIFAHGGGPIPLMSGRIETLSATRTANLAEVAPQGIDYELKRLYYDTANAAYPAAMAALLSYIPTSQIMFGTDYPSVSVDTNTRNFAQINLSNDDRVAIAHDNALRILPRLRF